MSQRPPVSDDQIVIEDGRGLPDVLMVFWKTSLCSHLVDKTIEKEVIQEKEVIYKSKLVILNIFSSETFKKCVYEGPKIVTSCYEHFLKLCEDWPVDESK